MKVFEDLGRHIDQKNRLDRSLTDLIGGPIDRKTLTPYRKNLMIPQGPDLRRVDDVRSCGDRGRIDIVFDCGSGFRNCAMDLQKKWGDRKERHLYIFGSHSHFDHTEGFDQAAVCFDPRNYHSCLRPTINFSMLSTAISASSRRFVKRRNSRCPNADQLQPHAGEIPGDRDSRFRVNRLTLIKKKS